jgi:hypothetical protein
MSNEEVIRYWIPSFEINKKVITQELQYHLGPEATIRPYTQMVLSMYHKQDTRGSPRDL